jgi:5-methylcytosine-specific restriction endonuclease McrA
MSNPQQYCVYCGRVAHRCLCDKPDSNICRFLERGEKSYTPTFRTTHYKRGVPPQIKKRERATMRKNHKVWYQELVKSGGEACANCGATENLVVDHILPIAKGGLSEIDNLQLLCATCNQLKGKLMIDCRGIDAP